MGSSLEVHSSKSGSGLCYWQIRGRQKIVHSLQSLSFFFCNGKDGNYSLQTCWEDQQQNIRKQTGTIPSTERMGTQGILDIAGIIKTPLLLLSSNNVSCLSVGDIHFCKISPLRACSRQYGCMDFVQMHPFSESISLTQGRVSHREEQFLGAFGLIILCTLGVAEKRQ